MVFLPVRTDFQHDTNKPFDTRLKEGAAFCKKFSLPGTYLVDNNKLDFLRWGGYEKFVGWGYMYVVNRDGKIVYRHRHTPSFRYDEVKFVLADRGDYDWAVGQIQALRLEAQVHCILFSPVHGELDPATLAAWILEDSLPVVLQLQEHKLLWPGVERGV